MTPLVAYLLLFIAVGIGFIFVHLVAGKLLRPNKPSAEKQTIYECGEPTIGSAWIQFDLRFYVVALLFVIFDVEVAFFFPWAEVFGKANNFAADTVMPSDYDTMKAYSVRVAELGPDAPENPPAALFRLLASLSAADMAQLKAIADATPKGASDREELESAHRTARKLLENLPNTPANAGTRRVNLVILALGRDDLWKELRNGEAVDLFPGSVDTNSRELLRFIATMTPGEYEEFRRLAVDVANVDIPRDGGARVSRVQLIRRLSRAELVKLGDTPEDTAKRRAYLALLLIRSPEQLQAFKDHGVPLTEPEFKENVKAAAGLSWLALGEIVLFFGILLVGFAYLWKRGDLAWVRSLQAERQAATQLPGPAPTPVSTVAVGAGDALAHH